MCFQVKAMAAQIRRIPRQKLKGAGIGYLISSCLALMSLFEVPYLGQVCHSIRSWDIIINFSGVKLFSEWARIWSSYLNGHVPTASI